MKTTTQFTHLTRNSGLPDAKRSLATIPLESQAAFDAGTALVSAALRHARTNSRAFVQAHALAASHEPGTIALTSSLRDAVERRSMRWLTAGELFAASLSVDFGDVTDNARRLGRSAHKPAAE